MQCGSCGRSNPDGYRFCGQCGRPLASTGCSSCGAPLAANQLFCGQCGAAVADGSAPSPPRPRTDERKLATVLFADVVGFTSMSERMDPEAVARTVDAAFRRLADTVAAHGGTVDKYMGDSLMAVFGVPQSHDDDAERAVAAGLTMREIGGDLAFSIGVNSGEVMVTSVPDGGMTVIGDPVNVAARLEKAAGPGEVLVGRLTAELAGEHVVFLARQPVVLKGKRDPVEVCEAVSLRNRSERAAAGADAAPLIGRDDELAFVRAQWRGTTRTRMPAVVLVTGDAGVGKSRLLEEFVSDLDGVLVVHAAYPGYGGMGAAKVTTDIIRQLGRSGDSEIDSRVRSMVGDLHPSLSAIDPTALQQEQRWALRRLIEVRAAERPVLFAVDDAHRTSERFLSTTTDLMAALAEVPVMMVLAGRPETGQWLRRFPAATTVRLGPMPRADAVALANALMPDLPLEPDAARQLADRAAGNPLFLRELVTMLRARQGFERSDGAYRLAGNLALPPSVQAILAARLDALSPDEKSVLQHVTVIGREVTRPQVEALGIADAGPALASLVAGGLLRMGEGASYSVADPLLGEVAYTALPRDLRGDLHRRAASVTPSLEDGARHLVRAIKYLPDDEDLAAETCSTLASTGVHLLDSPRQTEGANLLEKAIELGYRDPAVLLRLANTYTQAGRVDDSQALLDLVPESTGDLGLDAERMLVLANLLVRSSGGLEEFDEASRRFADLGDLHKQGWAHSNKGVALFSLGRVHEAEAAMFEGAELFERSGSREGAAATYAFLAIIRPTDPRVPDWLGEALRFGEESGDRTRQMSSLIPLAWHTYFRQRWGGDDDVAESNGYAERLVEISLEMGNRFSALHGLALRSSLARLAGRIDSAAADADEAVSLEAGPSHTDAGARTLIQATAFVSQLALTPDDPVAPPVLEDSPDPVRAMAGILVGEALVLAGRSEEALAHWETPPPNPGLGSVDQALTGCGPALTLLQLGRVHEALERAESGLESLGAFDAPPARAGQLPWRAEALARLGDLDGARAALAELPTVPGGAAGALVLRARTALGDTEARTALAEAARRLRAPGLDH